MTADNRALAEALESATTLLERKSGDWPPSREERAFIASTIRQALAALAVPGGGDGETIPAEVREALRIATLHAPGIRLTPERRHTIAALERANAVLAALQEIAP